MLVRSDHSPAVQESVHQSIVDTMDVAGHRMKRPWPDEQNRIFRHRSVHDAGAELSWCNFPQIGDDHCALCNRLGAARAKNTA